MSAREIVVEVWRGPAVESRHRVAAAVVDAAGRPVLTCGDMDWPVFPRSSAKPLQALALVESGAADHYGLGSDELALACASHSGTPTHTAAVAAWLGRLGLGPEALKCATHDPLDAEATRALWRAGTPPGALHHNCSGKHSGFLTVACHLCAPPADYLDPDHPVQRLVTATLGEVAGCDLAALPMGVDGCGVPAFALPLPALALGLARLGEPGALAPGRAEAARRIVAAMRAHPFLIGGPGRFDTGVMSAAPAVVSKGGAEGVQAAIVPERGLGLVVKAWDGGKRAAEVAMAAVLKAVGVVDLGCRLEPPILNAAGRPVGHMRAVMP